MAGVLHGAVVTIEQAAATLGGPGRSVMNIPNSMSVMPDFNHFDFVFPDLQSDPANLLPETPHTVADLKRLGQTMLDNSPRDERNSSGPARYTLPVAGVL